MTVAVPVRHSNGWLWLAFLLAAGLIAGNFVVYDGADDRSYVLGAEAWLKHFPALGSDHWATRHTVVLPVAFCLWLFGRQEWVLPLSSLAFFAGFLWLNFHFAAKYLGKRPAAVLAMLIASTPVFVVQASYINNDIVEVFFASASFWLFVAGSEQSRKRLLFASGIAAGLAFLTRETSAVLILFYGVCFLLDPRPKRRAYLFLALGFAAPILLEMVFFWVMSGNFLYRWRLDAGHDQVSRLEELRLKSKAGHALDRQGNLSVSLWADPFLMLFASQKYAALFYLAIPAALWSFRTKHFPEWQSDTLRRLARLCLLWIVFLALAFPILYLVPRYYVVPAWAGLVLIAYFFHRLLPSRWAVAAIALLVAGNALSLYLENTNPRFAEKALVTWLQAHPGARVRLDPDMARRADVLLRFAILQTRVAAGPPDVGDIYVYSKRNLELCKSAGQCKGTAYTPHADWQKLGSITAKPRAIGTVLRAVKLAAFIPPQIMEKIESPSPGIVIYRLPQPNLPAR
ncbi:4-amino-4-deoxy-L-arabinose transferase-like glycosyltransferase [Rhizomicrobium palustre]|uniref:4-amino-4-deoxy-L-arabinose transferase-like glycosyltransferase n=1 Tax=Rhizomicrobium palustre TaxID=189966 RepID=A0A846MZR8_9PROT|nr:glycosyltransferase family 39 protein [Rhizomicrobium palustre]NIK88926.1 4-amino-4-deoxy-L-arabinose transferase-like glycosyltransferase [Rhizomicrobium palustre]